MKLTEAELAVCKATGADPKAVLATKQKLAARAAEAEGEAPAAGVLTIAESQANQMRRESERLGIPIAQLVETIIGYGLREIAKVKHGQPLPSPKAPAPTEPTATSQGGRQRGTSVHGAVTEPFTTSRVTLRGR